MTSKNKKSCPKEFSAFGYSVLFSKAVFGVGVIGLVKNSFAAWVLGFEVMPEPKGIAFFIGPFSVGFFNLAATSNRSKQHDGNHESPGRSNRICGGGKTWR